MSEVADRISVAYRRALARKRRQADPEMMARDRARLRAADMAMRAAAASGDLGQWEAAMNTLGRQVTELRSAGYRLPEMASWLQSATV